MSTTPKASQPLVVVVSGGGPVGLTFSLHLTMMMGKDAKIYIHEGRWFVDDTGKTRWQGEKEGKTRRDQVVTLQDHVIEQMPEYIQTGLFKYYNERVWPTSRNIPIREVEDRLFELIQPFVDAGQVELVPENLNEDSECLKKGDFDVLVGADGANSFVRTYCNIQMISEGLEYACGVAYNIPEKVDTSDEPLHQAVNCVLTVSQTRYLVNSSTSRRGYLNLRLIKDEYDELSTRLDELKAAKAKLDLTNTDQCPESPVWSMIRQGLKFFQIQPKFVFRVVPIQINVRHASVVVRELRFEIPTDKAHVDAEDRKYKTAIACLAGDAAMNVHFWPGRGMNSGMKAAMALARNVLQACTAKDGSIRIRTPLRFLDFIEYEGFMARLRAREQQGRSLRVLDNPIDQYVGQAYAYAHLPHCYIRYTNKLVKKMKETRDRLQENPDWRHKDRPITDDELQSASRRISTASVAQLSLANPWPTREMSGADVLVERTYPYDLKRFLPVPTGVYQRLTRMPTIAIRYRFVTLWVVGANKTDDIDRLITSIRKSSNFVRSTANADQVYELIDVRTVDEAVAWVKNNENLIKRPEIRFKVVTVWNVREDQSGIDVIRAVRKESARVPVLIFTSKLTETQAALEFPNVMATDQEYELKEFIGANQETQWNPGFEIQPLPIPSRRSEASSYPIVDSVDCPALFKLYGSLDSSASSSPFFSGPTPRPSTSHPTLPAMLVWVDLETNDPKAAKHIRDTYPQLKMVFRPTFADAADFVHTTGRDFDDYEQLIIICRGYYATEKKGCMDITQLFPVVDSPRTHLAVYTRNAAEVKQKSPNLPDKVVICERREQILAFVDGCLKR